MRLASTFSASQSTFMSAFTTKLGRFRFFAQIKLRSLGMKKANLWNFRTFTGILFAFSPTSSNKAPDH